MNFRCLLCLKIFLEKDELYIPDINRLRLCRPCAEKLYTELNAALTENY